MEKITIKQFLAFTNIYVPIYIEDEFQKYGPLFKEPLTEFVLTDEQWNCPIDYIRNVDDGHRNDDKKLDTAIVLGIGIENFEKYFGKED